MDYEKDDTIDIELSPSGLIFRHIYIGHCYSNPLPLEYKVYGYHWHDRYCPECGANDFNVFDFNHNSATGGAICNICKIMWHTELGATCMECGRPLHPVGSDVLICSWCGQRWDLEVVKDAYTLGDHDSQIDWTMPRGANR